MEVDLVREPFKKCDFLKQAYFPYLLLLDWAHCHTTKGTTKSARHRIVAKFLVKTINKVYRLLHHLLTCCRWRCANNGQQEAPKIIHV